MTFSIVCLFLTLANICAMSLPSAQDKLSREKRDVNEVDFAGGNWVMYQMWLYTNQSCPAAAYSDHRAPSRQEVIGQLDAARSAMRDMETFLGALHLEHILSGHISTLGQSIAEGLDIQECECEMAKIARMAIKLQHFDSELFTKDRCDGFANAVNANTAPSSMEQSFIKATISADVQCLIANLARHVARMERFKSRVQHINSGTHTYREMKREVINLLVSFSDIAYDVRLLKSTAAATESIGNSRKRRFSTEICIFGGFCDWL